MNLLRCLVATCLLFIGLSAFANPVNSPVNKFLEQQAVIRILATGGFGFGDLVSSANVVAQLRGIGFKGKIEFIYSGKPKVIDLFDLPLTLPDVYDDVKNNIRFISIHEFIKQVYNKQVTPINVGLTGIFPINACQELLGEDPDNALALALENTITCKNPANFVNAKIYFSLSNWPVPTQRSSDSQFFLLNKEEGYEFDDTKTYFAMPSATLNEAKHYLETDARGKALLTKLPALQTFITGLEKKHFNLIAAYGWGVKGTQIENVPHMEYVSNLFQIINGARYAQLNGPTSLRDKPLVIAVFYDYQKEASKIKELMTSSQWGEYERYGAEDIRQTIKQLKLADHFSIASITDPNTNTVINNLQPGQILLLSMASLPKVVFDGLFTHVETNVLPQVREGAGSFTSLLLTGKPHFRCGGELVGNEGGLWEMNLDTIKDAGLKTQLKQFYSVQKGFCGYDYGKPNGELYKLYGELVIASQDPMSAFAQYFQGIKAEASVPENNRVYQAMTKAMNVVNGEVSNLTLKRVTNKRK